MQPSKALKKYALFALILSLTACADRSAQVSDAASEIKKTKAIPSRYMVDYPHLPKSALAKVIAEIAKQYTFVLSSQHVDPQKKSLFETVCHQLKADFSEGNVVLLSPDYIAESQVDFERMAPQPFNVFKMQDVYVEHNGRSVKYSTPQAPFEFYQVELGGIEYRFMYSWFSKLADKQGRYDSKGVYTNYNVLDKSVVKQTLDYSSNGHHPDLASSEGIHVLFRRNKALYLINTRQYFNPETPPDFLSIKQFDPSKGEFLSMCDFYSGFLARK